MPVLCTVLNACVAVQDLFRLFYFIFIENERPPSTDWERVTNAACVSGVLEVCVEVFGSGRAGLDWTGLDWAGLDLTFHDGHRVLHLGSEEVRSKHGGQVLHTHFICKGVRLDLIQKPGNHT